MKLIHILCVSAVLSAGLLAGCGGGVGAAGSGIGRQKRYLRIFVGASSRQRVLLQ